jgi:hypothetical protein
MKCLQKARVKAARKRLEARIYSAIRRRCEQFRKDQGAVLRSLKRGPLIPNTWVDRVLCRDPDDTVVLETEVEAVRSKVRTHFVAWFGARTERFVEAPDHIRGEYDPQPHISPEWFNSLMSSISSDELAHTIRYLPRGKAPGKSGLINELWIHASPSCQELLRLLLNECLAHEDIPAAWNSAATVATQSTVFLRPNQSGAKEL